MIPIYFYEGAIVLHHHWLLLTSELVFLHTIVLQGTIAQPSFTPRVLTPKVTFGGTQT